MYDSDGVSGTNPISFQFTTWSHDQENNGGTTYSVSNDSQLSSAMSSASAGDLISIQAGTYTTSSFTAVGSKNKPVKYIAANASNKPIFKSKVSVGDWQYLSHLRFDNGAVLNDDQYVVFNYCDINNNGIHLDGGDNTGTLVQYCNFNLGSSDGTPNTDTGIYIDAGTAGGGVARFNNANGGRDTLCGGSANKNASAGFSNWDFYNNTVTNYSDDGLEIEGGVINTRVYNNNIHTGMSGGMIGIPVAIDPVIYGPIYIFNNWISDGKDATFKTGTPANSGINPDGHVYILYNTIYDVDYGVFRSNSPPQNNIIAIGNALQCNARALNLQGSSVSGYKWDYNAYSTNGATNWYYNGKTYSRLADWQGIGFDRNGIEVSLGLNNPSNFNLSLLENSELIGKGITLSIFKKDIDGNIRGASWDIGADQFGVGSPSTPPDEPDDPPSMDIPSLPGNLRIVN